MSFRTLIGDTHPLRLAYHRTRGLLAAVRAGFPARHLTVIAITGTDGKTTTVAMISHILRHSGMSVAAASTAFLDIDGSREPNPTQKTSLSADDMQHFLKRAVRAGCEYAVIEASSHGLLQGRLFGIPIAVAGVTNVTMEHLDYHGTMNNYIQAKGLLFRSIRRGGTKVLNGDDQSFTSFVRIRTDRTIVFSLDRQLSDIRSDQYAVSATLTYDERSYSLTLPVSGTFNLSNALCAICCVQALGISVDSSLEALRTFAPAPGRLESIDRGQPFRVYIDFTVTPAAYEATLDSLRGSISPNGRLIVLTGSCGDRMPEKRPLVGAICSQKADIVIVTNEDPYTEDPERIIDDVLSGVTGMHLYRSEEEFRAVTTLSNRFCVRVSDRRRAIPLALSLAREGDSVIFCGKGADITMMTSRGQVPWVERDIVAHDIDALLSRTSNAHAQQKRDR